MRTSQLFVFSFLTAATLLGTAEARNTRSRSKASKSSKKMSEKAPADDERERAAPPSDTDDTARGEPAAVRAPVPPPAPARGKVIGIDGGVAMPTGAWGDVAGFGIGALARFEMPINDTLTFGARAGYIQHLGKDAPSAVGAGGSASSSVHEIPLFGGVRYAFSKQTTSEIYGAAELGLIVYGVTQELDGMSQSSSDTNFGMTLAGGYRTGKLDLRGGLLLPDLGHAGDAIAIMATVGYDITSL